MGIHYGDRDIKRLLLLQNTELYQAVVVQAFEDCLYTLGGKQEAYNKKDAHEWFMNNGKDFRHI